MPYLEVLARFRDVVRKEARGLKAVDILKECDKIRYELLDMGQNMKRMVMGRCLFDKFV